MEYESKTKQREERTKQKAIRKRNYRMIPLWGLVFGLAVYVIFRFPSRPLLPADNILARGGLHWHPELYIKIKGEDVAIPANIGLDGPTHEFIHTHDVDHVIHVEHPGIVTKEDVKLK